MNIKELLDNKNLSSGMRQYLECKQRHMDSIMFYRLGDFYEMFFDDAELVSRILELTLTAKACGLEEKAPMCGIPFKAGEYYLNKLVEMGYKVAICEQLEDPQTAKGLVKRDVIKIVTPGTNLMDIVDSSNYLLSVFEKDDKYALSYVDISQGDIFTTIVDDKFLNEELVKIKPSEIVFNNPDRRKSVIKTIDNYGIFTNEFFEDDYLDLSIIDKSFTKGYLRTINFDEDGFILQSIAILLNYIFYTQKKIALNINSINVYDVRKFMIIDSFTRESLELTTSKNKNSSLFSILNKTNTAMGSRLLKRYIEEPLIDKDEINFRLNLVEELRNDNLLRDNLSIILKRVYDMERLCGKIAFDKINAKELINLKKSIEHLPMFKHLVDTSGANYLKDFLKEFDDLEDIFKVIDESILEEPSMVLTDGNIIKPSYNKTLEKYLRTLENINESIAQLEESEKIKLGIKNLKIRENNSDGYYMEITKNAFGTISNFDELFYKKVKDLNSAYRFTFKELRELEIDIVEASTKSKKLEYELFCEVKNRVAANIDRLKKMAKKLASIDVFISLAIVSDNNNYVRPSLNENGIIDIKNGRHPVIEITNSEPFIGNDVYMDNNQFIHIITGPNMAGKSTFMRQVLLINLMAQIGSFVPCEKANISICDKIFARIGASDNLSNGESTFMVEMNEVSHIVKNATEKSLIVLDEVGRGTSTYDGISIAKSVVKYINDNIKCNTLFATHYFELTDLEIELPSVKNFTVSIDESSSNIKFLRKIIPGYADKSYGIYVAKLADMPKEILKNADIYLKEFKEQENSTNSYLENYIESLDLNNLRPIEALTILEKLKDNINKTN